MDAKRTLKQENYSRSGNKENPLMPCGTRGFVELLGRFELPTSSLPRMRSTD